MINSTGLLYQFAAANKSVLCTQSWQHEMSSSKSSKHSTRKQKCTESGSFTEFFVEIKFDEKDRTIRIKLTTDQKATELKNKKEVEKNEKLIKLQIYFTINTI